MTLRGREGQAQIAAMMAALRQSPPSAFGAIPVAYADDYAAGVGVEPATGRQYPLALDRANVLHYRFVDGGFVMVRPSGTEPKLKIYFSVVATDREGSEARLAAVRCDALTLLGLA